MGEIPYEKDGVNKQQTPITLTSGQQQYTIAREDEDQRAYVHRIHTEQTSEEERTTPITTKTTCTAHR